MHDDSPTLNIRELAAAEDDVPINDVFRALRDHRARYVIYYLYGSDSATELSVTQLADVITAWQATETGTIATAEDRDRMKISLYHSHLPKLDDLEYLTFDTDTNTITDIEIPPFLESVLELTHE